MKSLILFSSLLISLPLVSLSPAHAQKPQVSFYCSTSAKEPRTVAKTKTREINLVVWSSEAFDKSGFSPLRRCKEVSERLQGFANVGSLRYITTGVINNQKAICIASTRGGKCRPNGLVLTLEPQDNPNEVLKTLFSSAFKVSGGVPLLRGVIVLDLNKVFKDDENESIEAEPKLAN